MKPSEAMLKGFAMAGGRQCKAAYCIGHHTKPTKVCALGAMGLGLNGSAVAHEGTNAALVAFREATSIPMIIASDKGMSIPDIAGILASEGY